MILRRFLAMLSVRNKEFYRDRGAMMWNLIFPFLVILGFSFAFSDRGQDQYKVAVFGQSSQLTPTAGSQSSDILHLEYVKYVPVENLDSAIEKVRRHQFDILIDVAGRYWVNSSSPKGYFLQRLVPREYTKQAVEGRETRYVDWLIPGILAMNMMFNALFGVGYGIVRYRKSGVLKRLKATPVTAFEFLGAQIVSRLILIQTTSLVVFFGCNALVHFEMRGSYITLFLFLGLGGMSLIALSTLVAARLESEELAEGLLNLLTWPMMLFSGVWFSLEGTNPLLQQIAQIFPMTQIVDGARAIMLDGAGWGAIESHVVVLAATSLVFLALGSALFKWN